MYVHVFGIIILFCFLLCSFNILEKPFVTLKYSEKLNVTNDEVRNIMKLIR